MKQKIDQKTIIIVLMIFTLIFIVSRIFSGNLSSRSEKLLAKKSFDKSIETNYVDPFYLLDREIIRPIELLPAPDRDIFQEKVTEKKLPPLILNGISYKAMPLVFKGSIQRADGSMIAQINRNKRTHFVKVGDAVAGWTITHITKGSIDLISPKNENFSLKINEITQSDELLANVLVTRTNTFYSVSAGESFAKYKVLDIKDEYVTISDQGTEITLNLSK